MTRARIRTVKPNIWQNENLGRCSIRARMLFLGLITQADDEGRMRAAPELIRSLIFPYDDLDEVTLPAVDEWLQELAKARLIVRYTVKGAQFLHLNGWCDHQKIDRPTPSELPAPPKNRRRRAKDDPSEFVEVSTSDRGEVVDLSSLDRDRKGEDRKGKENNLSQAGRGMSRIAGANVGLVDLDDSGLGGSR